MEVNVTEIMEHSEKLEMNYQTLTEALDRIMRTANMKYNMTADPGWLDVYNWASRALREVA